MGDDVQDRGKNRVEPAGFGRSLQKKAIATLAMATSTHMIVIDQSLSAPPRNAAFQLACKSAAKSMSKMM
jgi:hypothetical protein